MARAVRDLLVLGHPRSGTGFMSQLLTSYGLPVGHERMAERGISSWMFAADADSVPYTFDGSVPTQFTFERIIQVVRSPEKVIASMAFASLPDVRTTNYMSRFIPLDVEQSVIEQAVQSYVGWNKLIRARNPDVRLRVEEASQLLPGVLREWGLLGRDFDVSSIAIPRSDYNSRRHRQLSWQQIRDAIPARLFADLCELSAEFGYLPDETHPPAETRSSPAQHGVRTFRHAVNGRCIILVPTYDKLEPATEMLLREFEDRGYKVRRTFGNAAIDQARNRMATDALAEGYEELLWFDSDMTIAADALERLRNHNLPIVGLLAAKKGRRALNAEFIPGTKQFTFGQGGGLLEVKYLGTGVLLTRRQVYVDIERKLSLPTCNVGRGLPIVPYFQPMLVPDRQSPWYRGEDYAFCDRARQVGHKIFADTTIRVDHIGNYRYSWEDAGSEVKRYSQYRYELK